MTSEPMSLALLAGIFTAVGAAITGLSSWLSARHQHARDRLAEHALEQRHELLRAHRDIIAFHRLEQRYITLLAADMADREVRTATGWKREVRRRMRAEGLDTPTDLATEQQSRARIGELRATAH